MQQFIKAAKMSEGRNLPFKCINSLCNILKHKQKFFTLKELKIQINYDFKNMPSLVVLYYNTILKGQYWYCIGVLANMCNTGDYAILSNTEIFVCNTEANMMQYQENSMQ